MKRSRALTAAAILALALSACGSDDDSAEPTTTVANTTPSVETTAGGDVSPTTPGAAELNVSLSDFSFGDLPDEVVAGTRLVIDNESTSELHELVAIRLPDGEERPVDEIMAGDLESLLGAGPPAAVLLAAPGGEPIVAVGDGTLAEPGRYLILCSIPTGVDPDEYISAAATSDGPPDIAGGPPHFVHGMVDDLTVTTN